MYNLHPWHGFDQEQNAPQEVKVVIEISRGSRCKYELDKPSGLLLLDRILFSEANVDAGIFPEQATAKQKLNAEKFLPKMQQEYVLGIPTT